MSGILDRCTCTPNARVFVAEGQVYCTRCLSARSLLPLNLQVSELGVLGLFYRPEEPLRWTLPRAFPTVECSPAGACWLSAIFPIARMTSGNLNFQQRMVRVAAEIYRAGQLTPAVLKALQVYERGCRWYPIVGPVPGVAVFANSLHVSDKPFPGATHVLTNLPLPQRPKPEDFCPFECAMATVYDIGHDAVMYVAEGKISWAPRGGDEVKFEAVPGELKLIANRLRTSFPPHHAVDMSKFAFTAPGCGVSMRVERQHGCLPADTVPEGNCWWSLFDLLPLEVQDKEIRHANQFGYQTKHGVSGKYLQRRLQVNGLRAVTDSNGPIVVQYFSVKESWIRHLKLAGEPSYSGFEDLLRIRVEPNTSPLANTEGKIFRFGSHKWYGAGKRARKARSCATATVAGRALSVRETRQAKEHEVAGADKAEHLKHYSPPAEGNCGWHCISAIANRMVNSIFETTLPERVRPPDDWATDDDLANAIQILRLPAALDRNGACTSAKYVLKLEGEHWTVTVTPGMSPSLLPLECVQGCCEHKGGLGSPDAIEVSGFDPACLDWLAEVMHLPSSAIPAALAEMSGDSDRSASPVTTVWTVSQFFARHSGGNHPDQVRLGKIISLCQVIEDCCCSQNKTNRVTPEEVAAKIDLYLRGATNLEECLARLEKARPPRVIDTSFDWDVVLPGVEAATQTNKLPQVNQCRALVPVVTQKSLDNNSVPLTAFSLANYYYRAQGDEVRHRERLTAVLSKLEEVVREEYGLMPTEPGPRPTLPRGLDELKDQMEEDLLRLANAQATSDMMAWAVEQVDLKTWVKNYPRWTPPPPPPKVQPRKTKPVKSLPERKPVPAPRRKVGPDCGSPVSLGGDVPNSWEDLAVSSPLDLPTPPEPATLSSELVIVSSPQCIFRPATPLSEPAPIPAPRGTVSRPVTPLSEPIPVPAPRRKFQQVKRLSSAAAVPLHQNEPLDLSASSQTEYEASPSAPPQSGGVLGVEGHEAEETLSEISDMSGNIKPASVSSSSSLSSVEITRPKYSAQAIIDSGGPCSGHLQGVKETCLSVMREACDATKLDDPATQEWLSRMWDRVDMLTWRNTSVCQAIRTLDGRLKFLPKMILETPPPYPCEFVMMPHTPAPSVGAESDLTIGSVATEDVPRILEKIENVGEMANQEPSAFSEDKPVDDQLVNDPRISSRRPDESTAAPSAGTGGAGSFTDLPSSDGADADGGGPFRTAKRKAERLFDQLSRQVFDLVSHLPVFFSRLFHPGGGYSTGDWGFAAFTLLCLFLCYSYPAFGIAPLLGVFSGTSRRVRMGVFGCWLAFAVGLFKPVSDPVGAACEFDSPECRNILLSFELLKPWDPVRSLVVGPVGLGLAILGRLLGGARCIWHFLLRLGIVADCILAGAYVLSQGRCKKCWGSCIRTAPNEVAFNVFPFTRATRSSLIDLCDRFCAPKGMDPIFLATGWRGCWAGRSPIEQPSEKPIAFAQLDEKKITARTVVAQPYDPNQAVKCLRVLQAGGAMVAEAVPKVVKVSAVPFRAPFFPTGVKVDPDCRVVVDPDTFTAALRSGYSTTNLVLGVGDFAQLNGLKIRQISKPSGGGPHLMAALHVACSMALHMLTGIYVTAVGSCGTGTNDPWCANPFAVPGYGPGSLCTSRLCISQHGLTLPLTALVAGFGIQEIALVVLIFVSIGGMAHRLSCKADMLCILLAIASYVWVPLTWLLCVFPCWLRCFSLHPLTILWLVFFLISVNMPSGILAMVLLVSLWLLGRYTNVAGLVTPYDIHHYTSGPRGVAALATAPDGTYLAAVRRAALTGRTMLFTPSQLGSLLEGAFRTRKPSLNTVNVIGSSMGSGGVFTIDGKVKCVTAAHVLTGNSARVSGVGFNQMLDFDVKGDFAIADCPNWQGAAPKAQFCADGWTGRAYWLTSSGVEPGVIGKGFAFCFTACGDSGSPVITEAGELVGVHTGSNKQGGGIVTRPSGQFCNVAPIKLSELSEFFAGPKVPLGDVKVGSHIIKDISEVPSDLCALLAAKPELEGGLSTVQLLCVFFLLWRMMGHAWTPLVAVSFFILNEVLPAVLVRSVFSFGMFVLSWLTPWSAQILMIRLLTAALNRNRWSLAFFSLGAVTGFVADLAATQGHPLQAVMNLSTYAFLPRMMVVTSPVPVITCGVVHLLAIILYLFKYRGLHQILVGDGVFSAAFFLRYFAEGKLREGVSQSCGMNHESLTGALAMRLNDEDLDFLMKWTDFKCFVSASNMRNAAGQFIEAAYAKALRVELAQLVQVDKVRGVLAKLEAFADTVAPQLSPGDIVVALGHTPVGSIFDLKVGSTKHTLQAIETRVLAGSKMTVARVVDPTPTPPPAPVPIPLPPKVLENGPNAWGDEDRLNKKKRRRMEALGIYVMGGKKYQKFWDKNSGDVFYEEVHNNTDEWECLRVGDPADFDPEKGTLCGHVTIENKAYHVYISPSGKKFLVPVNPENGRVQWEAAKLSMEQALGMMNVDGELTAKELEKLKRIIDKLQGLTKEQCLNLLAASGLTRCGRGGLVVTETAVKIVKFHNRTFTLGPVNLKVASEVELKDAVEHNQHPVARPIDGGVVLLRSAVPSLIDVLISGADASPKLLAHHGPGNTGIDGTLWDFESEATKEEVALSAQIIQACDIRRGDAPKIGLPYKLYPVRGNPERVKGVLQNTRFGDIPYKTPSDTGSPVHAAACLTPNATPVTDGRSVLATTMPPGFELYVPTIPASVLDYLDSRPDCPKQLTEHGCEDAALKDLSKYDLSTQGFVLPGVLRLVRKYLFAHVGKCPPVHRPSTYPAKNSMAGINGNRFPTKDIQSVPEIDVLCAQAVRENWQTVTPCTLKKQYCGKKKTRTILGTNNFIALAHRAALSGVTQGFMKKAFNSPIALGKNKFKELQTSVLGRCLEADLASCDRSTPAIVRWFAANLLYELACAEEHLPSYVLNCCHDLLVTQSGAVTKRGGLSSGDPITSVSNTIYSLVIYAQHMVLSYFKSGHPHGLLFLQDQLKFEDMLKVQPLIVYSDDLVLYAESPTMPNYHWWVEHLNLMLGFQTDPKKTAITDSPSFLGCRIINGRQLVPNRDRILAALAYHMKASNVSEYYASAAAILMDSCACLEYDPEWFEELVVGIAQCARKDGYSFPGTPFFMSMWEKLRSNYEGKKSRVCGYCGAPAPYATACGLDVCIYHTHFHQHCPVTIWCGHPAGSGSCSECKSPVGKGTSPLDEVLEQVPYKPPRTVIMHVEQGLTPLDPGRYQTRRGLVSVRRGIRGNEVELPDGDYASTALLPTCKEINMVAVASNVLRSRFIIGPPGAGKTYWLLQQVQDGDVIYTPTHQTMLDMIRALGTCRFNVPAGTTLQFPVPSRTGPWVRILAGGWCPGKNSFLDEAAYCNHLDVLRLLSKTTLTCLGDFKQLHPVGFDSHCYVFDIMPQTQLKTIWRFGQNICDAIQPDYRDKLMSMVNTTRVTYVEKPVRYGQVLTPYHRDREDDAITIDSSQGATFDVVTLHLPTKDSLNRQRALVAITRARHAIFVYDPHRQLQGLFDLPAKGTPVNLAVHRDGQLIVLDRNNKECTVAQALGNGDKFRATDKRVVDSLRAICADLEGSSSPLPKVAHNLGFYFSPDLTQFAKLPVELAPHWPVVTTQNNEKWPDRLVASLRPIHKYSRACIGAGYMVGPSVFLGTPGVVSYYLTKFVKGEAQLLPETVFSTGRIEVDCREYLDDREREVAASLPHAFIGDVKGTTVGGCHHVTSRYLPRVLPKESVAVVGVSSPGKAAKALCTLTDVYLPDLEAYLHPETQSKCWKMMLDFKEVRLMVWRDKTAYFQLEGRYFTWYQLASYASYIRVPVNSTVYLDPCMGPALCNRRVVGSTHWGADLAVTPYDYGAKIILSSAYHGEMPPGYKILACAEFSLDDPVRYKHTWGFESDTAYLYEFTGNGEDWEDYNDAFRARQEGKIYKATATSLKFHFPPGPVIEPTLGLN
ncbi:ORF 1ab polyprotein [Porcine reproductive and respiratory syndrome virus]|uniref:ORF 1ab polyprotein n=2 Tax=Porcine reproductive and respiratory syndrome virus TaxID=28344 RepID=UPI0000163EA1|nr:ORF 1ab polyprotein [Porcine reproductive and respiratory syndrome virus]